MSKRRPLPAHGSKRRHATQCTPTTRTHRPSNKHQQIQPQDYSRRQEEQEQQKERDRDLDRALAEAWSQYHDSRLQVQTHMQRTAALVHDIDVTSQQCLAPTSLENLIRRGPQLALQDLDADSQDAVRATHRTAISQVGGWWSAQLLMLEYERQYQRKIMKMQTKAAEQDLTKQKYQRDGEVAFTAIDTAAVLERTRLVQPAPVTSATHSTNNP